MTQKEKMMITYQVSYREDGVWYSVGCGDNGWEVLRGILNAKGVEWLAIRLPIANPVRPLPQLPPVKLFSQDTLHPATCPKRYGGRREGAVTQNETADIDNIPPIGRTIDGVAYNRNLKRNDLVAIQCGMVTSEIMKKARK